MKNNRALKPNAKKDKALSAAGIAIIRWQAGALPDETAIRKALAK